MENVRTWTTFMKMCFANMVEWVGRITVTRLTLHTYMTEALLTVGSHNNIVHVLNSIDQDYGSMAF